MKECPGIFGRDPSKDLCLIQSRNGMAVSGELGDDVMEERSGGGLVAVSYLSQRSVPTLSQSVPNLALLEVSAKT